MRKGWISGDQAVLYSMILGEVIRLLRRPANWVLTLDSTNGDLSDKIGGQIHHQI